MTTVALPPFWSLVEAHGDELLAHARRLAGDQHAEDVLQDALLRALRAYPRLRHAEHLRAWLYRVTTTAAIDAHRARRRELAHRRRPRPSPPTTRYDDGAFEALIAPLPDGARPPCGCASSTTSTTTRIADRLGMLRRRRAPARVHRRPHAPREARRMTPLPDSLLEAVAAAAVREGLADAVFTRLRTPDRPPARRPGRARHRPRGLRGGARGPLLAEVAAALGPRIVASDRELAATRDTLDAYFAGEGDPHALPVDLALVRAPFRRAVLETLHDECAAARSSPTARSPSAPATRAPPAPPATACARNPIPIVVPCHRVLPGSGGIGNYGGGPARKRALLELEGRCPLR